MKRIAIAAGLLLLAGCSGPRLSVSDFFEISRQVLQFAEEDARRNQPGRVADGPLYVNVHSFRSAGHRATGHEISEDSMSRALGEPVQALPEQVLLCDTASGFGGCWVRKYGVWVNLNLLRHSGDEVNAFVRTSSTDRRTLPTLWCDRVWRVEFRKTGNAWRRTGQRMTRNCTEPQE